MALVVEKRAAFTIKDGKDEYNLIIAQNGQGGRGLVIDTRPYEPGDPSQPFRVPLHPFDAGFARDRLKNRRVYAKGNGDASVTGVWLFPPKLTTLTLTGALAQAIKAIEFNGTVYILTGRFMFTVDSAYTVVQDKDFGVGKAGVDMAVFNNELIVAMGETEKIWKRTTAAWSQAADNTFAIALGVVDNRLWRAETTNLLSSCSTTPLTLTSWTPSGTGKYQCGDTTYAITCIVDYGNTVWVGKGDGVYQADPQIRFKNQTPQARQYPHVDNCRGMFVAQGYLWVPTAAGLLRVASGRSQPRGPEITQRRDYRYWVRGGIGWGGSLYLVVNDQGATSNSFIIKMTPDMEGKSGNEYIYEDWCDLGGTTIPKCITVSTVFTNPSLIVGWSTGNAFYAKLGRGAGPDSDDANYAYGTATSLQTGFIQPSSDLSIVSTLVGVRVLCKFAVAGETLTVSYSVDGSSTFYNMKSTAEGGGAEVITLTNSFDTVTRYAQPNTTAQFFDFKFTGALTATTTGTTRPEIREAWAFGYAHPRQTDVLSVAIVADTAYNAYGNLVQKTPSEMLNLFRQWSDLGTVIEVRLNDYEENRPTRFVVSSVKAMDANSTYGAGTEMKSSYQLQVEMIRCDYANAFAKS